MKKVVSSNSQKNSNDMSWHGEVYRKNPRAVDRDFEELLKDVKTQTAEEDDEALEDQEQNQETSTNAGVNQYDELRWEFC